MKCIVCSKRIHHELCYQCKEYYKKYPTNVLQKIMNYYRKLRYNGGKENGQNIE